MAVVQISKIQVRRGKKNQGGGMPQLASGEIAWAIDTQELYIGNGAVSEGAPYVGNTKVLTEHDNILELLATYQYKYDLDLRQSTVNSTSKRSLQSRLDDGAVNAASFDIKSDEPFLDQTAAIQAAIDALFSSVSSDNQTILEFNPGEYLITSTVTIPSNVQIKGYGKDVTVFRFSSVGSAFVTSSDSEKINLKDFTIKIENDGSTALTINNSKNSKFTNLKFISDDGTPIGESLSLLESQNRIGIRLLGNNSVNSNYYTGLDFKKLTLAVKADSDASFNMFDSCNLEYLYDGFSFGFESLNGADYNSITNTNFDFIARHGIVVHNGKNNISRGNKFKNVGNDFSNISKHSIIKFVTPGNTSVQDLFDRANQLRTTYVQPYVPEIEGTLFKVDNISAKVTLAVTSNVFPAFRLPLNETNYYEIKYVIEADGYIRTGTMTVAIDRRVNDIDLTKGISLVDDYDVVGTTADAVEFSATAESNVDSGTTTKNVRISYTNPGVPVILTYTCSSLS